MQYDTAKTHGMPTAVRDRRADLGLSVNGEMLFRVPCVGLHVPG